jgi:outer membrane protein OmpA-like peptidoglycan-associated protein
MPMGDLRHAVRRAAGSQRVKEVLVAVVLTAVLLVATLLLVPTDDDGDVTTDSAPGSSLDNTAAVAAAESTTSVPSTAVSSTTTLPADGGLSLPAADPSSPPVEPFGVYGDGKVTLLGSVPDQATAQAYARKAANVLGETNVTVQMTLDPRVTATTMRIDVNETFRFPENAATIDPQYEALLNLGAAALQLMPEATLVITGHTDSLGSDATNLALSHARAQVVVDYMIARGIPAERIIAVGAGETQPIAPNETPEGRAANRRIEASLEGITPG